MPRGPRLDAPGTLHHVMIRGIEKARIVKDDQDRADFVSRLATVSKKTGTAVYAWALLNNHAHILLRSGSTGLPGFMRKLLSGYAGSFNRRHHRYGHVFQNRYKSIVCEEDPYFQRLVCYIHLNPLRAGLVRSLEELDGYPWCGHSVIMNRIKNDWQDRAGVLEYFGATNGRALKAYRQQVEEQSRQGRQPELTGGGLIRSMGGWSAVRARRRQGVREQGDARILGNSGFVQKVLSQARGLVRYQIAPAATLQRLKQEMTKICRDAGITETLLQSGSRRQPLPELRKKLAHLCVLDFGLSLAETARRLGVSTSAVARMLERT